MDYFELDKPQKLWPNIAAIEEGLQKRLEADTGNVMGLCLHRHAAMGVKNKKVDYDSPTFLCRVFVTFAFIHKKELPRRRGGEGCFLTFKGKTGELTKLQVVA